MKFMLIFMLTILATCWSLELDEDAFVCYAPDDEDYGSECEAPLKLKGGDDVKLTYSVKITNPDKQRVWCEGRSFYKDDTMQHPEPRWYLLGGGIDSYDYTVAWNIDEAKPSIRCRSLGDSPHLVEYKADLKS